MRHISTFRTLLAVFVLAFICLNVGGALCMTYCVGVAPARSSTDADPGRSDHCRHAGKEVAETEKDPRANARSVSCCMLPLALFAAAIEKRNGFSAVVVKAARVIDATYKPPTVSNVFSIPSIVYRPPPLDHNGERLQNGVIRI